MGLKSMHAEKQSEQPQQSVQDNSLIEQQSQRIAELMKEQEQDSYLIEQQSQKIAELERHISQITQQSQKKDSQISEAISQAEEWKARADQEQTRAKDQERKLLEEQLNLKKTLQKKGLQASEAISQAEEWKNQAEKSEIQIQKLLSEKQELVSTVAEQGKRIAEQTEQIEKLNEADNVLKLNAELKKQNEKLKQDKLNAEQEAEATVSSVKREYEAKGRELDRRIGEAAKQSASLKSERQSISEDIEQRAAEESAMQAISEDEIETRGPFHYKYRYLESKRTNDVERTELEKTVTNKLRNTSSTQQTYTLNLSVSQSWTISPSVTGNYEDAVKATLGGSWGKSYSKSESLSVNVKPKKTVWVTFVPIMDKSVGKAQKYYIPRGGVSKDPIVEKSYDVTTYNPKYLTSKIGPFTMKSVYGVYVWHEQ